MMRIEDELSDDNQGRVGHSTHSSGNYEVSKSRTLGPDWQFLTLHNVHNVHMPIAFGRSNVESTSPILDFAQIN